MLGSTRPAWRSLSLAFGFVKTRSAAAFARFEIVKIENDICRLAGGAIPILSSALTQGIPRHRLRRVNGSRVIHALVAAPLTFWGIISEPICWQAVHRPGGIDQVEVLVDRRRQADIGMPHQIHRGARGNAASGEERAECMAQGMKVHRAARLIFPGDAGSGQTVRSSITCRVH